MIARLRWALVKAVWIMAGVTFLLGAYLSSSSRFF
jgi:hypothetical protein